MSCSPASVKLKTNKVKRMVTGDINAPTNMLVVKDKLDKKQYIDLAAERLAEKGSSCKVIHKKAKDIKEQSYEQTTEELAYELMRKNVKYKDMSNEQLKKISDGDKHSPLKKSVAFGKTTTTDTPPHINRGLGTDKCPKFKVKEMITPTMTKKSKINRVLTNQERDAAFLRAYGKGNCKLAQKEVDKYIDMLYFSIDGWGESYERDRAPAKWGKLIKFLKDFETINRYGCDVVVNYVVNAYNVDDIEKVDNLRKENNLGMLRLNIAQIWDEDVKMKDDIRTSGYTREHLDYLRDTWGDNIMGKSKWNYNDCFWVNNALYTTVEGNVKMCCLNTGAKPFGNLFINSIDEIREMEDYQNVKKGCETNNPSLHCKNCSYKELSPMLKYLGV